MRRRKTRTKDPNEKSMRRLVKIKTGTGRNWTIVLIPIMILKIYSIKYECVGFFWVI
jgi:hypothetical protein